MSHEDNKLDFIRNKKDAIIVENLDNNAPVEKIVEVLQATHRKNKVSALYCHTVRQRYVRNYDTTTTQHYLVFAHPLNAFSEDWDGGLNSGYFEEFSHRSLLPRMIAPIRNIETKDPITEYMQKKEKWHATILEYKRTSSVMKAKEYEWIDDNLVYCSRNILALAEEYGKNPDRYFEATFNWYYAGHGNMQQVALAGADYMLQSVLTCFYVHRFTKYSLQIDYDNVVATFDCGKEIHETIMSSNNIIALRTRNIIFILKLIKSDVSWQIEKIQELEQIIPFTGISFDEYHKNIMYVTSLDYKLTIVNLDRMSGRSKQLKGNVITLVDNWSRVIGSERGYFTHVSRFALTLYDKRTNLAFQRWKNLKNVSDIRNCNEISVAKHCNGRPFLYFGTSHHLFLLDMRYKEAKDGMLKTVQRWSHGMQCPPVYMTLSKMEPNKDLICMTSQWCEDICVVGNYSERPTREYDIRSIAMPYRPPSILQALNQAKQRRLCCDYLNPIDDRLCTSISGLSVVEQGENYHILMLNSLGDIMSYNLHPRHMTNFFEDDSIEILHEWSKQFKKEVNIHVTSIIGVSKVWRRLKRIPDTYVFENRLAKKRRHFNAEEIHEAFKNEEVEPGLLEIWTKDKEKDGDVINLNTDNDCVVDDNDSEKSKQESALNLFFVEE